jgi:cold shock CspA family protein
MPKASKTLSLQEQADKLKIANRMFAQKKDFVGEKVDFGLIGQIVYWNDETNHGYIRTRDMDDSDDSYFCRGADFCNQCGKKDIVKFDVWENYQTRKQKAVNVEALQRATTVIATDEIGTMVRCFGLCKKGIIEGSDGKEYRCSEDDFEQGSFPPRGARVCFDIARDNWTLRDTAVNIRSAPAKIVRHVHLAGVEGRVVKLGHSFGFVSTALCDKDIYFNGTELVRVHMQHIQYRHRIICDVIMEEDGLLTAENINMHRDKVQKIEPAARDTAKKAPAVDDAVKKVPAVDDDCASTSTKAATDLPEATFEPINSEVRKLTKKLREIEVLEGRQVLDQLQQAKVAMKHEYQKRLKRLTA